jgi:hypothetical protein
MNDHTADATWNSAEPNQEVVVEAKANYDAFAALSHDQRPPA